MVRRIAILLYLATLAAFSQGLNVSWNRFASSPAVDPCTTGTLPSGMAFRWRSSDLNSTPVNAWVDSIQGNTWTASGSARPAWDANGVHFDGVDDSMTVTNLNSGTSSNNWLVVLNFDSTAADKMVLDAICAGGQVFLATAGVANKLYESSGIGPNPIGTNLFDIVIAKTTNSPAYRAYTNGVSGWSNGGGYNDGVAIANAGSGAGNCFFKGVIQEVIVWTNQVFTECQVASIHSYVTNTYAITP